VTEIKLNPDIEDEYLGNIFSDLNKLSVFTDVTFGRNIVSAGI